MKLFGYEILKANNATTSTDEKKKPLSKIQQTQLTRSKADIQKWRTALLMAESKLNPTRVELLRIYQDVILDAHISAMLDLIRYKIKSNEFTVEGNEALTEIFKNEWFYKVLTHIIDSEFYGYSLVQFGDVTEAGFSSIDLIPREYVQPETSTFVTMIGGSTKYSYIEPPFNEWTLFFGDKYNLGTLNKATPLYIWKKFILGAWADYNQIFGVPIRVGKTDIFDEERRLPMKEMLENMGQSAWGVFHAEDAIEIMEANTGSGFQTFESALAYLDEQVSKLFTGQTMSSDDGSSRSQAEVHERTLDSFTAARMHNIEFMVNGLLLPFMATKGFNVTGKFTFMKTDNIDTAAMADILSKILPYYVVDVDFIEETLGIKISDIKNAPTQMALLNKMYKDGTDS